MTQGLKTPIAYGRTAEIYEWQDGQVLKLFHDWCDLETIEYEARIARAIHDSGVNAPYAGEIIKLNGRNGLIYQHVDGKTMGSQLTDKPWKIISYAKRMAELHVEMHAKTINADIPSQRKRLNQKINEALPLPKHLRTKILTALETMPDGNKLCHGDFHPYNILMAAQGDVVIDWIDASCGNPLADLARTTILILGALETNEIQRGLPNLLFHLFHTTYIRHYFKLSPGGELEYNRWLPIVAAARLNENIIKLEKWLITKAELILR